MGFQIPENATADERRAIFFNALYSLNLNDKVEKKNGLSYLSWSWAWAEFKKIYPSASYKVVRDPNTHLPYTLDENLGIMVYTEVTADGLTYEMWLPVMDSSNRAMKTTPYTYKAWDKYQSKYVEKQVEGATMFDINKALMRCLVKNLAMFGEGLYLYAKEDLPEDIEASSKASEQPNTTPTPAPKTTRRRTTTAKVQEQPDRYAGIKAALQSVNDMKELLSLYQQHKNEVDGNPDIKTLFTQRKEQIKAA